MESQITVPPELVKIKKISRVRLRGFTKEEARRYRTQFYETDGYDMDQYPQVEMGLIIPLNIETNPTAKGNALKFGYFAVQQYNNKQEAEGGGGGVMLEFVKPLKINIQGAAGFNYYITFEAKDVGAPDDQSRIYQAKVFDGVTVTKVLHFRLKPTGPLALVFGSGHLWLSCLGALSSSYSGLNQRFVLPENEPPPEMVKIEKFSRVRLRGFTEEEACCYETQLYETYVELGLIIPLNIETNPIAKGNALKFGDFAVQDYNNKQEAGGGGVMLEFVKPLKINIQGAAGFNYYITFEAKDIGASDDQSRIYQAKVFDGINVTKVTHFRLKPTAPGNSGLRLQ